MKWRYPHLSSLHDREVTAQDCEAGNSSSSKTRTSEGWFRDACIVYVRLQCISQLPR